MKILIAGDLIPTNTNIEEFEQGSIINHIDSKFKKIWENADFRMFNLECPLGENYKPIHKNGPNLIASSKAIVGIKSLNPNLVFLANNHILDYGTEALENTLYLLNKEKINYTGIIDDNKAKNETFYIEKDNIKIGIYNLCENEFSVATQESKGANPLNEIKNYKEIQETKKKCDYLIVIFHGGKELYRYPSPKIQKICRNFIDMGANLVITQHSHCIGCMEEYASAQIIYGQGNFIFDKKDNEFWNTSLLIELEINKELRTKINYIPLERYNGLIRISNNENILKNFWKRTNEIKKEGFIEEKYNELAMKNLNTYLNIMHGIKFHTKILNKLFNKKFFQKIYNKKDILKILNTIECESHRELFIRGLKLKIESQQNKEIN